MENETVSKVTAEIATITNTQTVRLSSADLTWL